MSKIIWLGILCALSLHTSDSAYRSSFPILKSAGIGITDAAATLYRILMGTYHPPLPHRTIPREPTQRQEAIQWIGHATLLIRTANITLLTDPVFWDIPGHIRYSKPGIDPNDMPHIDIIILSHNHYDHCDIPTLQFLRERQSPEPHILCPRGVETLLRRYGHQRVTSRSWWQSYRVTADCHLTCVPAHHWSGRDPWSIHCSDWAGWLIQGRYTYYFAGDTACNLALFRTIRSLVKHIDVAALPVGPHTPRCLTRDAHLHEDQFSSAAVILNSIVIPIHHSTFRLGPDHPDTSIDALQERADEQWENGFVHKLLRKQLRTLKIGETYTQRH